MTDTKHPRYTVSVTKFGIKDNIRNVITHGSTSFTAITEQCKVMNVVYDKSKEGSRR